MKTPTKVWPLEEGLPGYNAQGHPITLQPGVPGWMDMVDALAAEKAGGVDIMAGKTPQTLRTPQYRTRVMTAEPPLAPPPAAPPPMAPLPAAPPPAAPPHVPKVEAKVEEELEEKPKAAPRRKTAAKKRTSYRRTDTTAK